MSLVALIAKHACWCPTSPIASAGRSTLLPPCSHRNPGENSCLRPMNARWPSTGCSCGYNSPDERENTVAVARVSSGGRALAGGRRRGGVARRTQGKRASGGRCGKAWRQEQWRSHSVRMCLCGGAHRSHALQIYQPAHSENPSSAKVHQTRPHTGTLGAPMHSLDLSTQRDFGRERASG